MIPERELDLLVLHRAGQGSPNDNRAIFVVNTGRHVKPSPVVVR